MVVRVREDVADDVLGLPVAVVPGRPGTPPPVVELGEARGGFARDVVVERLVGVGALAGEGDGFQHSAHLLVGDVLRAEDALPGRHEGGLLVEEQDADCIGLVVDEVIAVGDDLDELLFGDTLEEHAHDLAEQELPESLVGLLGDHREHEVVELVAERQGHVVDLRSGGGCRGAAGRLVLDEEAHGGDDLRARRGKDHLLDDPIDLDERTGDNGEGLHRLIVEDERVGLDKTIKGLVDLLLGDVGRHFCRRCCERTRKRTAAY